MKGWSHSHTTLISCFLLIVENPKTRSELVEKDWKQGWFAGWLYAFTSDYGLCVVSKRIRLQIQVAEMSKLHPGDRVRCSVTQEGIRVELILWIEISWFRWFGHVRPASDPRGRPRTRWRDYVSWLARGIPWKNWNWWQWRGYLSLGCFPCELELDKLQEMDGWICFFFKYFLLNYSFVWLL